MKQHRPNFPACPPPHPDGCGCPSCRAYGEMCRQQLCGCDRCAGHNPPACRDQPRFLLPRIVACGRIWHRCAAFTLQPEGLPDCLRPPLMLVGVSAGCQPPMWELTPGEHPSQACMHVVLPLSCQVRDCTGCTWCASACIETDTVLRLGMPACECWKTNVMILPCIRMVCQPPCSQCACFDVQLEIAADIYLTRWEPCAGGHKPSC